MREALKRDGPPEEIATDGQEAGRWTGDRVENGYLTLRRRERAIPMAAVILHL